MSALARIGRTPLLEIEGVLVKLECSNPGGSVKDRIALFLLERAAERGELEPGYTVVEATSGNTGIALSMVARALGYRALIFMPEHMSVERRRMIESLGAEVRLTPEADSFAGAIALRDSYRGRAGYYVPDQFGNPDNTLCHRLHTGAELVAALRERGGSSLDAFVAGVGTGGTLMGVGQALRAALGGVRVVGVEPAESSVMSGGPPGSHGIQGIGDGFIPALVDMEAIDEVVSVSTEEAADEAHRIRRLHGYCVGLSSGANMVAARRLAERGEVVATVWPDCADRYVSLGLHPPSHDDVRCPLQSACSERAQAMLGG